MHNLIYRTDYYSYGEEWSGLGWRGVERRGKEEEWSGDERRGVFGVEMRGVLEWRGVFFGVEMSGVERSFWSGDERRRE